MKTSGVIKLQHLLKGKLRQARELRRNMTSAEALLWERLRLSVKKKAIKDNPDDLIHIDWEKEWQPRYI
jgi:very-short-patch-repair endonuclease